MQGYQVTFYTQESRRHGGKLLSEWLLDLAKDMQLKGATVIRGIEGLGHDGRVHSWHFFELADQPVEVCLAVTAEQCNQLFARLEKEDFSLFYIKTPIELGTVGQRKQG